MRSFARLAHHSDDFTLGMLAGGEHGEIFGGYLAGRSPNGSGVPELTRGGTNARQAVLSYVDVVESAIVLDPVIDEPDPDVTNIDVMGPDQRQAAGIVNAVGGSFTSAVAVVLEEPDAAATPVRISIIEEAQVLPSAPVSPNLTRNIPLGLMLGLIVGAGVAGAAVRPWHPDPVPAGGGAFHRRARTRCHRQRRQGGQTPPDRAPGPRSARSESFRILRTNLQVLNVGDVPRSFVIPSAAPNEERKPTGSTNLVLSLVQTVASVVLADADISNPSVAKFMGVDGTVCLSNRLVRAVELDDVLNRWGQHEFYVLPAGRIPPNPSELLGSGK